MTRVTQPTCCGPKDRGAPAPPPRPFVTGPRAPSNAVEIPGGRALIGTRNPHLAVDGEGPMREQRVKPFLMARTAVTNAEFAAFIQETGHKTEAESFGWSYVFWQNLPNGYGPTEGVVGAEWWRKVDDALWSAPNGPGTEDACLPDHPVVHVSWNDARAYCAWVGGRLPTEVEWEHAARGGLGDVRFPWGDQEPDDTSFTPCNIWQGDFPDRNTAQDGFAATAPAQSFEPNGYGLYNMVGNAWEWCADPFRVRSLKATAKRRQKMETGYKLIKGGSFLCHKSYCYRYRIAARSGTSPDSTTAHQGFRVVWSPSKAN